MHVKKDLAKKVFDKFYTNTWDYYEPLANPNAQPTTDEQVVSVEVAEQILLVLGVGPIGRGVPDYFEEWLGTKIGKKSTEGKLRRKDDDDEEESEEEEEEDYNQDSIYRLIQSPLKRKFPTQTQDEAEAEAEQETITFGDMSSGKLYLKKVIIKATKPFELVIKEA